MPNTSSSSLFKFLAGCKRAAKAPHTHTRFDGTRVGTLSIEHDEIPILRELLFKYVDGKTDTQLGHPKGLNAISEKVVAGAAFRFFIDLDFALADIKRAGLNAADVISIVQRYIRVCIQVITDLFGAEFARALVACRIDYKAHLHFPDLIVEKPTAIRICNVIREAIRNLPLYEDKVLDQSVYNTGLRMVYCHKGALGGKGAADEAVKVQQIAEHEAVFGAGSYRHVYEVVDVDDDGDDGAWKPLPKSLALLEETSILKRDDQELTPVPEALMNGTGTRIGNSKDTNQVAGKGKKAAAGSQSKRRRLDTGSSSGLPEEVETSVPPAVKRFVEDQYDIVLNGGMKLYPNTKSLTLSTSNQQECPFVQRSHKGNNVYVYIDAKGAGQRCHDSECKGKTHDFVPLGNFPQEVVQALAELSVVIHGTEDKLQAVTREMQRLDNYPLNRFHIDPDNSVVEAHSAMLMLSDLYCPKCKKEHESPQAFLQCNPAGEVVLRCLQDMFTPSHPLTSIPPAITNMLFQGSIQININQTTVNNNYEAGQLKGPRDFGQYEEFPKLFELESINRLCYESLVGHTFQVSSFVASILTSQYIYVNKKWYKHNKRCWIHCDGPDTFFVKEVAPVYQRLQATYSQSDQIKWLQVLISDLSNKNRRKPYLEELEGILNERGESDIRLDSNPTLIPLKNGVYDSSIDEFRNHKPEDYITKTLSYDLPSTCNTAIRKEILDFFESIMPDVETRTFLMTILALHLEGRNRHQIAVFLTGSGGNGKGVLKTVMANVLEEFMAEPKAAFFTEDRDSEERASPALLSLTKMRGVYASEPGHGRKINGSFLKFISGEDAVRSRANFSNDLTQFIPRFIPILLCNNIPLIDSGNQDTRSLWRRIRIISFPMDFVNDGSTLTQPNQRRADPSLGERIKSWAPEMMLLLIEIFSDYVANDRQLHVPESVMQCVEDQKLENNTVARWCGEHLIKEATQKTHMHRIFDAYNASAEAKEARDYLNRQNVRKRLESLGYTVTDAKHPDCTITCDKNSRKPMLDGIRLVQ